jgi:hypothetical protein
VKALGAPAAFAWRRLRARPLSVGALVLALAAAGALIGWSSIAAALAQDRNVELRLGELAPGYRAVHVAYNTLPFESDLRGERAELAFRSFADSTGPVGSVRVWHSIETNKPAGIRVVVARDPVHDVVVTRGRLPAGCDANVCEVLALTERGRVGRRIRLPEGRTGLVVGRGSLRPGTLPSASLLGSHALLVRGVPRALAPLLATHTSTVVYSAVLDPERVHGFDVDDLNRRLHAAATRLQRDDSALELTAPFVLLDGLARRGDVAHERLLLIAGQGAALIVAFAAFVGSLRRRERELADDQLATLGASRAQLRTARLVEVAVPCLTATVLALAGLVVAALAVGDARGLGTDFVVAALPPLTILAVLGAEVFAAALLLVVSLGRERRPRLGLGTLELAALVALGVVVWQATVTGALDADRIAGGEGGPLLLLLPALGFFVAGVILLRAVPPVLRLAERVARRGPFGVRLAFLSAARSPGHAAAATTFLAVALGSALFSLDYARTLEQQASDQARFAAGAASRLVARSDEEARIAVPLRRSSAGEPATPALRLPGHATGTGPSEPVRVLALPAARLGEVLGWRASFSADSRDELAQAVRPAPVRLRGPPLSADATALRIWARGHTFQPRTVVAHLLLPGQRFAHVRLGEAARHWKLLEAPLDPAWRGAQLVGLQFVAPPSSGAFDPDVEGYLEVGPLEQRGSGGWSGLASFAGWREAASPDQVTGLLNPWRFKGGPVASGARFELYGTLHPEIHPDVGLGTARRGFVTAPLPAIVSPALAREAIDGVVTVEVRGRPLALEVAGTSTLFPTVTEDLPFAVLDYDTVFAALNADEPGSVLPTEAWYFGDAAPARQPPFRLVEAAAIEQRLLDDPLAAGARTLLVASAIVAALLALVGLVLAARAALASERLQLAEYEALGVAPASLRRSAQVRLVALSTLGVVAGLVGAFATLQLVGAFVAVTGAATRPIPPIAPAVAWAGTVAIVAAVAVAAVAIAAFLTGRAIREPAARRLRA